MLRNGVRYSLATLLVAASLGAWAADTDWETKISVEARVRGLGTNDRDFFSGNDDNRSDLFGRIRVGFGMTNPSQGITLFVQPQEAFDQFWSEPRNDNTHDFDLFQAYFRWQSEKDQGFTFTGGRQTISLGDQRLVGENDWDYTARSWDSGRLDYKRGNWSVTGFGGTLGVNGADTTHPDLFGLYSSWKRKSGMLDVFWFQKHTSGGAGDIDESTLGGRFEHEFTNRFELEAQLAAQFGKNQGRDIQASMASVDLGYNFTGRWSPRFEVEGTFASGGDPNDSKVKTFDQLYPSNHNYYGIADFQGLSNLRYVSFELSAHPTQKLVGAVSYQIFQLDNEKDAWYGNDGGANSGSNGIFQDPTGSSGRDVGKELDLQFWYRFNPSWQLRFGYARFMPGDLIKALNSGNDHDSDYGFIQVTFRY